MIESKIGKLVNRLDSAMFSLDKESNLVRKLQKEKVLAQTRVNKQLGAMKKDVMIAKDKYQKSRLEKLLLDDRVKDLNSQLTAAWKAVNDEKNAAKRESSKYQQTIKETNAKRKELVRKNEIIEKKLMAVDKQHKQALKEKLDLDSKMRNMSVHLQNVER